MQKNCIYSRIRILTHVAAEIARLSLEQDHDLPEPPPPPIGNAGIITVDVTEKFADAVKSMDFFCCRFRFWFGC